MKTENKIPLLIKLLIPLLFFFPAFLNAQYVIGEINVDDPQEYHQIKFRNGSSIKAKIIALNDSSLSFHYLDDTITAALTKIYKIKVKYDARVAADILNLQSENLARIYLHNGSYLSGKVSSTQGDTLLFWKDQQLFKFQKRDIKVIYALDSENKNSDILDPFQSKNSGIENIYASPTGFSMPEGQWEYKTYGGIIHTLEAGLTKNLSLTFGFSIPDISILRAKLSTPIGKKTNIGFTYTRMRSVTDQRYQGDGFQLSASFGSKDRFVNITAGTVKSTLQDFGLSEPRVNFVSAGSSLNLGSEERWRLNFELMVAEEINYGFYLFPVITTSWMNRYNRVEFGLISVVDVFVFAIPYLMYSRRIY